MCHTETLNKSASPYEELKAYYKQEGVMAWIYLIIAGLFECGWAIGLKYTEGFTRLIPSLLTVAAMALSFWLLSTAMKTLPVGTAYAVWTGIGAIGVAIMGMVLFDESRDILRIISLMLIVCGIIGLKLGSK
jgi:quaternary ammonium compound-resistance protein SugE